MISLLGIGLDLVDLKQFATHYDDEEALARCFTDQELADVAGRIDRLDRLAARFAVKEAVYKALSGIENSALTDIETILNEYGAPQVQLYGAAKITADTLGVVAIKISLTHSTVSAAAVAVALSSKGE